MSGLTVVEFGDQLLRTRDLDPVYVAVAASGLDEKRMCRLLLAYWCFYHLGAACRLAESKTEKLFWMRMKEAAANEGYAPDGSKPWPRGAERRHFRGAQAVQPVAALAERYADAEEAVLGLLGLSLFKGRLPPAKLSAAAKPTFHSVTSAAQGHRGFGPWISFKIADMAERVLRLPVDFNDCELGIYKDPRQGAAVALQQMTEDARWGEYQSRPWDYPITDEELRAAVDHYVALWRKKRAMAPPHSDRLVNVQEIETIFCKYKSHLKGHYPMGKDTREVLHGLEGWGDLAGQMAGEMRKLRDLCGSKGYYDA